MLLLQPWPTVRSNAPGRPISRCDAAVKPNDRCSLREHSRSILSKPKDCCNRSCLRGCTAAIRIRIFAWPHSRGKRSRAGQGCARSACTDSRHGHAKQVPVWPQYSPYCGEYCSTNQATANRWQVRVRRRPHAFNAHRRFGHRNAGESVPVRSAGCIGRLTGTCSMHRAISVRAASACRLQQCSSVQCQQQNDTFDLWAERAHGHSNVALTTHAGKADGSVSGA